MFSWRAFAVAVVTLLRHHRPGHQHGLPPAAHPPVVPGPADWLEYFFALCGALTLEGGPIFWVATHRMHHQNSDQPGDPHSPRDGAWWSHVGWILVGEASHNNTKLMAKYAPDLAKHRFYVWLNNWHWVPLSSSRCCCSSSAACRCCLWGILPAHRLRSARHLAGQLRHPHVGRAPLRHARRFAQQLVGGAHLLRRGLAQQPSRASHFGAPRAGLVRVRPALASDQAPEGLGIARSIQAASVNSLPAPSAASGRRTPRVTRQPISGQCSVGKSSCLVL